MAIKHWKKLSTKIKHKNNWWNYQIDKYIFPTGKEGEYHYVHTAGSAFIIPILDDGNPYNGITDEICHVFIARNLKPSTEETKDEFEEFEIINLSVEEIEEQISTNKIYDGMTMASWALAKNHFK